MSEQKKKVSLFKQKIKQAKQQNLKKEQGGFPVALLLKRDEVKPEEIISEHEENHVSNEGLLHLLNRQQVLKEEEVGKIEQDNWSTIDKMSQKEREEAIAQLKAQLSSNFLKKVIKGSKSADNNLSNEPMNSEKQDPQKEAQHQKVESTPWIQTLKLNIKTNKLELTQLKEEHLITLDILKYSFLSNNNKSQIFGLRMLKLWANAIDQLLTSKTRQLIIVNGFPIHGGQLGNELMNIVNCVFQKVGTSNYKTIFLDMCQIIAEVVIKMGPLWTAKDKQNCSKQVDILNLKLKNFDLSPENKQITSNSLKDLSTYLAESQQEIQWKNLIESADVIVELSLMESQSHNGYWFRVYTSVESCGDLQELLQILEFIYEFVNRLIIKRNMHPYINVKVQRELWNLSIDLLIDKFTQSCWSIDSEYLFQTIFLARFVGGTSWQKINQTASLLNEKSHLVTGFILFHTLPDLKQSKILEQQLQSLNRVFDWINVYLTKDKKHKINPNYLFSTLLELFFNQQQFYSSLNQEILQNLISKLVYHPSVDIDRFVSSEQIITLTSNYNFNSFRNHPFTYLLLSISSSSSLQKQARILKETIMPSWQLFMEVSALYEFPKNKPSSKNQNRDLKEQILDRIKSDTENMNPCNFLVSYLCE